MKRIILFILFFVKALIFGQTIAGSLDLKSANTYEIEKRGNVPVNLNVGTISENIPLFSYKMPDGNNLNIDVFYNSSGFMPNKKSAPVGYNWAISTGGQITRTVKGNPDDVFNYTHPVQGFLMTVRDYPKGYEDIYNHNYPSPGVYSSGYRVKNLIEFNGYDLENQPDHYKFNFMGNSGYFHIGNDGKPVISSEKKLKISIDSLSLQSPASDCTVDFSQIIITDDMGVKYYFGGQEENLEILYNLGSTMRSEYHNDHPDFYINSWHLRKVVYPNNEILYFENKKTNLAWHWRNFCMIENVPPYKVNFAANVGLYESNTYFNQSSTFQKHETGTLGGGDSGFQFNTSLSFSIIKKVVPENIKFKNHFTVSFKYSVSPLIRELDEYLISEIQVKNATKNISTINFNYTPGSGEYKFLTSVKKDDQNYDMQYKEISSLPPPLTKGIDYWGFWNGKHPANNSLIPRYTINLTTGDFNIIGDNRKPNPDLIDIGLLRKITYPTGGFSEFEYEANTYSRKVGREVSTDFFEGLVNSNDLGGGARIKKIISNDGTNTNNIIKEYKYISNYQLGLNNGLSSGILENDYKMVSFFNQQAPNGWYQIALQELSSNINLPALSVPIVRYSEVSELIDGNLSKKTYFTDYSTNPDVLNYRVEPMGAHDVSILVPPNHSKNVGAPYSTRQNERGKILKTILYSNNKPAKSIENKYIAIDSNNYFTNVWGNLMWVYFSKHQVYPYVLGSTITTDFLNNGSLETKVNYLYENSLHNGITKINTQFPDYSISETSIKYAHEKGNQLMLQKNMIGIPLETLSKNTTDGKIYDKSRIEVIYPTTQDEADAKTAGLILPISNSSHNLVSNTVSTDISFDQYSSKGNVIKYTKGEIPTAIVWGYNETLPIAKIQGKDLETFLGMFSTDIFALSLASNKDVDLVSEEQFRDKLDLFQSRQTSFDVVITTYIHDPLVGVTSVTPPSGIREVYIYDSNNRLKEIREKSTTGKLIKEIKYKYKN